MANSSTAAISARRRDRRPVDVHVGQRVRERRRLLGLGRADLARVLGLSVQQVQKYETGDSTVSASRLYELGIELGVPPSYFFEDMPVLADIADDRAQPLAAVPHASEVRQMISTYRGISNPGLRHHLYELARAMAKAMEMSRIGA